MTQVKGGERSKLNDKSFTEHDITSIAILFQCLNRWRRIPDPLGSWEVKRFLVIAGVGKYETRRAILAPVGLHLGGHTWWVRLPWGAVVGRFLDT